MLHLEPYRIYENIKSKEQTYALRKEHIFLKWHPHQECLELQKLASIVTETLEQQNKVGIKLKTIYHYS